MSIEPFVARKFRQHKEENRTFYLVLPYHPCLASTPVMRDLALLVQRWRCELHNEFGLDNVKICWRAAAPNLVSFLRKSQLV